MVPNVAKPCAIPMPNPISCPSRRHFSVNAPMASRISSAISTAWSAGLSAGFLAGSADRAAVWEERALSSAPREMTPSKATSRNPVVPGWDKEQYRNKNRVRGKKERDLAVGETKCPGNLRRNVVADTAEQNPQRCAEGGSCPLKIPSSGAEFQLGIRFPLMFCVNHTAQSRIRPSQTESGNQNGDAQSRLNAMPSRQAR